RLRLRHARGVDRAPRRGRAARRRADRRAAGRAPRRRRPPGDRGHRVGRPALDRRRRGRPRRGRPPLPRAGHDRRGAVPARRDALAADPEQRVVAYTGLVPGAPLPPPEAVDRQLWAEINLAGMRRILDPVVERLEGRRTGVLATGPLRGFAGALLALEVGGLT